MGKMFSSMMEQFTKDMPKPEVALWPVTLWSSEEDNKKMKDFGERMAGMCSCMTGKEMTDEEKKAMAERVMTCCGDKMEMMSSDQRATFGFFKKMGSQSEGAEKSEKA